MAKKIIFISFLVGLFAYAGTWTPPVDPEIPNENRHTGDRIFLERADRLYTLRQDTFQILVGDVLFRKQDMFMYCDSAHFYPDNSMKAFGNVRMEQGDTLFVYADSMWYDNETELTTLYAWSEKKVKLINKDVMLETDEFYYDMGIELGYYEVGGVLTDANNRLVSQMGEYSPSTKDANFYTNVILTSLREGDTLTILTDTLIYNTDSHIAVLTTYSTIINKDGIIYTTEGIYNTDTQLGELYDRSMVVMKRGNTITGDTLFYDRNAGFGEAFGNMILTDSVNQMTLTGDYGFYNELTDSIFVTGHALAMEHSRPDTLYLHGDTIRGFKVYLPEEKINDTTYVAADSTHYLIIEPKVRFYRVDLQGVCDSMTYIQIDSTLYMDKHPVVWTENRQIFGNEIRVHLNDSTVDKVILPTNAFSAEMIEDGYFDQLAGREMIAYIDDGELRHLDVSGNVMAISFPMENDSTYNKVVSMESSYLEADFKNQTLERMKVWPEVKSVITPLYLAKKSIFFLPQFRWLEPIRPISPEDVFYIPQEMLDYFSEPEQQIIRNSDDRKQDDVLYPPGRRIEIRYPEPDSTIVVPGAEKEYIEETVIEVHDSIVFNLDSITGDTISIDTLQIEVPVIVRKTIPKEVMESVVDSVVMNGADKIMRDSIIFNIDSITGDTLSVDTLQIEIPIVTPEIELQDIRQQENQESQDSTEPPEDLKETPIKPDEQESIESNENDEGTEDAENLENLNETNHEVE